ncbi:unnamed protein product, partial [Mesorhabditis spiculigera]
MDNQGDIHNNNINHIRLHPNSALPQATDTEGHNREWDTVEWDPQGDIHHHNIYNNNINNNIVEMDMEAELYSIQYSIHNNNNQGMWPEDSNSLKCRQANRRPPAILNNILSAMGIQIHMLQWHLHIHIPHIVLR